MVAIKTTFLALAMSLLASATPTAPLEARQAPPPGSVAANLRFFGASNTVCDASQPADVVTVFQGTGSFVTGTCYTRQAYGSVAIDSLQPTCRFIEYTTPTCRGAGTSFNTTGCKPGNGLSPTYFKVLCGA